MLLRESWAMCGVGYASSSLALVHHSRCSQPFVITKSQPSVGRPSNVRCPKL